MPLETYFVAKYLNKKGQFVETKLNLISDLFIAMSLHLLSLIPLWSGSYLPKELT